MKKILTLLVLLIMAQLTAQGNLRYLYRSGIVPNFPNQQICYIIASANGDPYTDLYINGQWWKGSNLSTGSLAVLFPDSIFQSNINYAVIEPPLPNSDGTGLNKNPCSTNPDNCGFSYFALFYDLYDTVTSVIYYDNTFYYWFIHIDSGLSTTPTVSSDGTPISLATNQFTESSLSVYPNPTTSFLNVSFNKEFSGSICDFTGKKLLSFSTKTVDLSQLASGIYVLDVISEDKRYTKKIIKQ